MNQIGLLYNPALVQSGGLWHRARARLLVLARQGRAPEAPVPLRVRASLALGMLCYGGLALLCQLETLPPLPDPRLPLAVADPRAARSANWRRVLDNYWCPIMAGSFWYGDDRESKPLRKMTIPYSYKIARYPVTNADFARFVAAGGYQERRCWTNEGWRRQARTQSAPALFDDSHYNNPLQPVVGVTWYEAAAYCIWLTEQGHTQGWLPDDAEIRLPTSLEWERSARHTDKRRYPWGDDEPTAEHANYRETGINAPSPVGCFPAGAAGCGALDMVGNTMEWMATLDDDPQTVIPKKDFTLDQRVLLAFNDFSDDKERLCCGARDWVNPYFWFFNLGFRIVWSLRSSE